MKITRVYTRGAFHNVAYMTTSAVQVYSSDQPETSKGFFAVL